MCDLLNSCSTEAYLVAYSYLLLTGYCFLQQQNFLITGINIYRDGHESKFNFLVSRDLAKFINFESFRASGRFVSIGQMPQEY